MGVTQGELAEEGRYIPKCHSVISKLSCLLSNNGIIHLLTSTNNSIILTDGGAGDRRRAPFHVCPHVPKKGGPMIGPPFLMETELPPPK